MEAPMQRGYRCWPPGAIKNEVCLGLRGEEVPEDPVAQEVEMATTRQVQAAKRNVKRAQEAARRKRTIANLPESTRRDLGKQGAKAARRGGEAGHALEDRTREQLYEIAKRENIRGRSNMGKWELIQAIRASR